MNFEVLREQFIKLRTKRKIESRIYQYKIVWFFEGFEKLVNYVEFTKFMSQNIKVDINGVMQNEIEARIIQLREIFKISNNAVCKMLLEIGDDIADLYHDYLQKFYTLITDFIGEEVIKYVFYNLIHKNYVIHNKEIDPVDMYEYKLAKLQVKILKSEKEVARALKKFNIEFEDIFLQYSDVIQKHEDIVITKRKRVG